MAGLIWSDPTVSLLIRYPFRVTKSEFHEYVALTGHILKSAFIRILILCDTSMSLLWGAMISQESQQGWGDHAHRASGIAHGPPPRERVKLVSIIE